MFECPAKTVSREVVVEGVGLHSGAPVRVRICPAAPRDGIAFVGPRGEVPAHWSHASAPGGSTRIGWVETPEHLLAALVGLGITDARIEVDGELPALDGSALPWVEAIGEPVVTGTTRGLLVTRPVEVALGGGVARLLPADRLVVAVDVDFGPALRGRFEGTQEDFVERWCWARTFLPHRELDAVRAAGLGKGLGPGSVVVWGERGALVPLRSADEPIRHKALDVLGDLALAGAPIRCRIEVERGTHALHQAVLRTWLVNEGS